jgi:hypothetical protein
MGTHVGKVGTFELERVIVGARAAVRSPVQARRRLSSPCLEEFGHGGIENKTVGCFDIRLDAWGLSDGNGHGESDESQDGKDDGPHC